MSQILRKWIAANAIDETKIDSAALGNGLIGGSGTVLSVNLGTGLEFGVGGVINVTSAVTAGLASDLAVLTSRVTTAEADINTLETGLAAEIARATAAEGTLTTNLAAEVTRATTAEGTLTTNLAAEVTRATAAEDALDGRLDTAEADIDTLEAGLAAEIARATAADTTLTNAVADVAGDLADEVTRATTAEGVLTTAISNEATARANADTSIKTNAAAEIVAAVEGAKVTVMHKLVAADLASGYTLAVAPANASVVEITPVGGIPQVNAANVGDTGLTGDFSVAGSVITFIDALFAVDDVVIISYIKDTSVTIA